MRSIDWSQTALGPIDAWSPTLQMMVRLLLANRFQLILWWGPEFCQLYNTAYQPVLGVKHPQAMGQPGRECWPEIWHIIGPLIERPFCGGEATWMEDILLEVNRFGFTEETHFTIAYSPVPDDTAPNGIGGVLVTVHEITEKVVGERRVVALRDLGARAAEALVKIDRVKTLFFSNVSHEFRTPLTLMLGPLEEMLAQGNEALKEERAEIALVHRNGLRLLKLVNTLLDFSRIEAGRMQANYEPTDLAAFTADLASSFRSAVEKAGLRLVVDCPPLPQLVYVDRDMWEKIVLNLLSNASKFGQVSLFLGN